ncbi:hypothetical protein QEH59_00190 [Coraliomargarita sp. SDUM461004]|uniref:Uncharacterized protein n=1 Tax=Thalassobacterium sedimentorum TaxID=3041258 RepID=A0ABU1ADN7_9BACT|nr:hypothetical protein [Coraliomargarita sp. SDUM461004]MDQ8192821.1 hypothetical protein [Coraliomargarita sp. SDUM461004]
MNKFRTILRYSIDPQSDVDFYIDELLTFCQSSQIEEVMLLLCAEELSVGHMTEDELKQNCDLGKRLKQALDSKGIDLSLNPWSTLYQVPRGRKLHSGQHFRTMVGESGAHSPLVACPLCQKWQNYQAEIFAKLTHELQPVAIWFEDDWRLHNHGPELGWGGCFCEEHMRRFSELVGEEVDRPRLLETILQSGTPHPWRKQWFKLSRQSLLEPLDTIRAAMKEAHSETRLALMTSRPDQHSIEGRDWQAIQDGFGYEPAFMVRPHMEPYTEERALRRTVSVTRQTLACLTGPIEVYPELENSPRCGIYSKSARYTVWQMLESAAIGSDGITINHFDNMGNGIEMDPDFSRHLARAKPMLNAIAALNTDDRKTDGVQVLFSDKIASHLQLPESETAGKIDLEALSLQMQENPSGGGAGGYTGSMQSLVHPSPLWAETCTILGIAHRLTQQIEPDRGPILVNGQTLNTLSDAQLEKLFSGFVVLDALAVETVCNRGLGHLIGIESIQWRTLEQDAYSYEAFDADLVGAHSRMNPRVCAQRPANRVLEMATKNGQVLSQIHGPDHAKLWPGAILAQTPQNGQVLSLTYPMDGGSQFFMAFFTKYRRLFFQNLFLKNGSGGKLLMSPDGTRCYRTETKQGTLFSVLNATLDLVENLSLRHDDASQFNSKWSLLNPDGQWRPIDARVEQGAIHYDLNIEPLSALFLIHHQ